MSSGWLAVAGVAVLAAPFLLGARMPRWQFLLILLFGISLFLAGVTGPMREQRAAEQRAYEAHMRECTASGQPETDCWTRWQMARDGGASTKPGARVPR